MTTRDVADLLGLSSEAVLRRWRAGELPGYRLSTRVLRFRESEVFDWLESRREGQPVRVSDAHRLGSDDRSVVSAHDAG